jgi:hypothetical protein
MSCSLARPVLLIVTMLTIPMARRGTLNRLVRSTPHHRERHMYEVYINHDVWKTSEGQWGLASQTTVKLDGTDNGKPVHESLASPHPIR